MADTPFEDKYTQVISASKVGEDDAAVDTAVKKNTRRAFRREQ